MKKHFFAFAFALALIGCKDSAEQSHSSFGLTKSVGGRISFGDGERWSARYRSANINARTEDVFSVGASSLRAFVESLGDYDGLHFKHALDNDGRHHILIIPHSPGTGLTAAIDTNTDEYIAMAVAEAWTENYVDENPSGIRSHFFGSLVFASILSRSDFEKLVVTPGIDDSGKHQLLLYAWNGTDLSTGRTKEQSVDVYDLSTTCPPHCSQN